MVQTGMGYHTSSRNGGGGRSTAGTFCAAFAVLLLVAGCPFIFPPVTTPCVTDADCGDGDACTVDTCNVGTGECLHEEVDCDDGDLCTVDTCDSGTGDCVNEPIACLESEVCDAPTGECVPEEPPARTYVGSDTCAACHGAIHDTFMLTGHPFKLNEVVGGQPPEFPVTTLAGPPAGLEWEDLTFVIGGFRWKCRVIDADGFVVLGPAAQYNFPSQVFGAYNNDDGHTTPDGVPGPWETNIGRKPYACGPCHMTAYDAETDNRRGLPGLSGDWEFDGVQCEECHDPGSDHVASMSADDINGHPDTDIVCGKCHTRSADGIAASGGFVRHHEQWDEFSRSVHAPVMADGCMTCHNTHEPIFDDIRLAAIQAAAEGDPTAVDGLDPPPGIVAQCADCHGSVTVVHPGGDECISCHMAFTGKSAQSVNANMGDIRSHAWKIDDNAEAMMFTDAEANPVARDSGDTAFAALDEEGQPFITLDFACLRCHTDKDVDWAATNAASIHGG